VGPDAERLRVAYRLSSGLGTWSIRSGTSGTAETLFRSDSAVCSQPLTFEENNARQERPGFGGAILCGFVL